MPGKTVDGGERRSFVTFRGPAVLYLKRAE
jgi:hypothetical protein